MVVRVLRGTLAPNARRVRQWAPPDFDGAGPPSRTGRPAVCSRLPGPGPEGPRPPARWFVPRHQAPEESPGARPRAPFPPQRVQLRRDGARSQIEERPPKGSCVTLYFNASPSPGDLWMIRCAPPIGQSRQQAALVEPGRERTDIELKSGPATADAFEDLPFSPRPEPGERDRR